VTHGSLSCALPPMMLAAWPFPDFEINVAESRGCCDRVPFFEVGRPQDVEVLVDGTTSQNSGAGIPVLDENGSVSASRIDDGVGVTVEKHDFTCLNGFMMGQSGGRAKMEETRMSHKARDFIYSMRQSNPRDKDSDLHNRHTPAVLCRVTIEAVRHHVATRMCAIILVLGA